MKNFKKIFLFIIVMMILIIPFVGSIAYAEETVETVNTDNPTFFSRIYEFLYWHYNEIVTTSGVLGILFVIIKNSRMGKWITKCISGNQAVASDMNSVVKVINNLIAENNNNSRELTAVKAMLNDFKDELTINYKNNSEEKNMMVLLAEMLKIISDKSKMLDSDKELITKKYLQISENAVGDKMEEV